MKPRPFLVPFAILTCFHLPACVTIGHAEPQVSRRVISTEQRAAELEEPAIFVTQNGPVLDVKIDRICATEETKTVEIETSRERINENPTLDWMMALGGALGVGVGGGMLVKASDEPPPGSSTSLNNEASPELVGGALAGIGAVMLLAAGVDVVRAQGTDVTRRIVEESTVLDEHPCDGQRAPDVPVTLTLYPGSQGEHGAELGVTKDAHLSFDLNRLPDMSATGPNNKAVAHVGGKEFAVDLSPWREPVLKQRKRAQAAQAAKDVAAELESGRCTDIHYQAFELLAARSARIFESNMGGELWKVKQQDIVVLRDEGHGYSFKSYTSGFFHVYVAGYRPVRLDAFHRGNKLTLASPQESYVDSQARDVFVDSRIVRLDVGESIQLLPRGSGCGLLMIVRKYR